MGESRTHQADSGSSGQTLLTMLPENLDTAIASKLKRAKPDSGETDAPADSPPAAPQAPAAPGTPRRS